MRINAKFGKCKKCDRKFDPGEEIEWSREGGSYCVECYVETVSEFYMDILEQHALADRLGFDNPPTPIATEKKSTSAKAKPKQSPQPQQDTLGFHTTPVRKR